MLQDLFSAPVRLRTGICAGRAATFLVFIIMAITGTGLWGTTQTVVYNGGNIPSTFWVNPSTTKRADQPGLLSVSIPAGQKIASMDVQYSMSTNNGSWMSEQNSFLLCSTNGLTEEEVYSGEGDTAGVYTYNRHVEDMVYGLYGVVDFELHAFRTWGGNGSNMDYQYVVNGTWQLVLNLEDREILERPTGLAASNIAHDSALLSWTDNCYPNATSWDIIYACNDFYPYGDEGTLISNIDSPSFLLSGLEEDYERYYWYVRANKGDLGVSNWSRVHSFLTLPADAQILVYDMGNIPSTLNTDVNTSSRADSPGLLSVTIPPNKEIKHVGIQYSMSTDNGSWMSEQRSFLLCSTNGATESEVWEGEGQRAGICDYRRDYLNLARGLSGVVDFELHAFRTWGGSGTDTDYQYVMNGSWQLIIELEEYPVLDYPSDLEAFDVGPGSAVLSWEDNCYPNATEWDIMYEPYSYEFGSSRSLISNVTSNPYLLTGLVSGQQYLWSVRANKGDLGVSDWAGEEFFTTLWDTEEITYTLGNIPTTLVHPDSIHVTNRALEPGIMEVTVPPGKMISGVDLDYAMTSNGSGSVYDQRSFLVCSTNNGNEPVVFSGSGSSNTCYYSREGLHLANGLSGTVVFELHAFRTRCGTGSNTDYNYVNNGSWTLTINYADRPPSDLSASNIGYNSAQLNWTENSFPAAPTWDIMYGPIGFDRLRSGTLISNVSSRPYTLSGLYSYADYEWMVRSRSNSDWVSDWSAPHTFTTLLEPGDVILTYNLGDIPTTYEIAPTTSSRALEPGLLSVTVPAGKRIERIGIRYIMSTNLGGRICEQRSFLLCGTNGVTEPEVFEGSVPAQGMQYYGRDDVSIANGLSGVVDFELHAFRNWGGTGSNTAYNYVYNGTWALIVHYEDIPVVLLAPVVTFSAPAGVPQLSWTAVPNANSYKLFGSDDPYSSAPWRLVTITPATTLSYTPFLSGTQKFFRVQASSDMP